MLATVFHFIKTDTGLFLKKAICISVFSSTLFFFLFNSNYFPQLLKYQNGNVLAEKKLQLANDSDVYFWKKNFSSSFVFYTASLRKQFDSTVFYNKKSVWILFDDTERKEILQSGYSIAQELSSVDYEITRFSLQFYIPSTREKSLKNTVLAEITLKTR